jgi:hypothetical protein
MITPLIGQSGRNFKIVAEMCGGVKQFLAVVGAENAPEARPPPQHDVVTDYTEN